LPIKLSTCDLEVFLIEASRKKVHFLKHVIRSLNLKDIQAEHIRAEALAQQLQPSERFNVVISRAVSSLEAFYAMAAPLAAAGGALMAMKSKALPAEIAAFDSASKSANDSKHPFNSAISITVKHLKLPLLDLERSIVIMRQPTA
jgi:16S rRNA (guanine527-N7)-methyltransferase